MCFLLSSDYMFSWGAAGVAAAGAATAGAASFAAAAAAAAASCCLRQEIKKAPKPKETQANKTPKQKMTASKTRQAYNKNK